MKIKSSSVKKKIKIPELFFKLYFFISIIVVLLTGILFFNTGYWKNYKNEFLHRLHLSSVYYYTKLPEMIFMSFRSNFYKIEKINLNISFENLINLENQRRKALEGSGKVIGEGSSFTNVNANINVDGKVYRTNVRIKGDRNVHFKDKDSTSYKFNLKGDKTVFGMEKFSLQKPRTKNYIHEWIYHELLGEAGLINLKYDFVNLSVNGSNESIYAIEESFDTILIERNKKRNGPIFSLYEEFSGDFFSSKFEVYNEKFWNNEKNINLTQIAKAKLQQFREGKLDLKEVFDIDLWASFFAASDINYYQHGMIAKSVKFYYNPVSAKFEPIGYDGHRFIPNYSKYIMNWNELGIETAFDIAKFCSINNNELCVQKGDKFIYKFFYNDNNGLNKEFFNKYRNKVLEFSSKEFLDKFFKQRKEQINKINSLIYSDYFFVEHNYFYGPGLYYFSKNDIYFRANFLQNYFKKNIVKIFVEQTGNKILVSNGSINNSNISIKEIVCRNNLKSKISWNISINKKILKKQIEFDLNNLITKDEFVCTNLIVQDTYGNLDSLNIIQNYSLKDQKFSILKSNNFSNYFKIENNKILLKKNTVTINENVIIPPSYVVYIYPGQKIILEDKAFIFSNSSWKVNGGSKFVEITGKKDNYGGGILISDNKKESFFKNVNFQFLDGLKTQKNLNYDTKQNSSYDLNYILYGALNIFNTKVKFENVNFVKICSEDALNIISSNFYINNSTFSENCSDSIDVDFGEGKIINSKFINIGNDAIDFSGSNADLNSIKSESIGDKIVSAGENSKINITNLNGKESFLGIASKDGSVVTLNNINLFNVKIGLASYVKKSEYLNGKIFAKKIKINQSVIEYLKDPSSKIIIDNIEKKKFTKKIIPIIYNKEINLITN